MVAAVILPPPAAVPPSRPSLATPRIQRALAMGTSLLALVFFVPTTTAAWAVQEVAHSGFTVAAIPAPAETYTGCVLSPPRTGRNPNISITWLIPADWVSAMGSEEITFEVARSDVNSSTPRPGALPDGVARTTVVRNRPDARETVILGPDLPSFQRAYIVIGIRLTAGHQWVGPWMAATISMGIQTNKARCELSWPPLSGSS